MAGPGLEEHHDDREEAFFFSGKYVARYLKKDPFVS